MARNDRGSRRAGRLQRAFGLLEALATWPGRVAAWAVLLIMLFTVTSVVAARMRIGTLASWDDRLPLIGNQITLAGLTELQWHAFGVMVMLGGAWALLQDRHIRVDILYGAFGPRLRRVVDVLGDLVFLIPFCIIIIHFSLGYVERSFVTGERSDYGGLRDRYLIKAMIPVGLGLLLFAAVVRVLRNLAVLFGLLPEDDDTAPSEGTAP